MYKYLDTEYRGGQAIDEIRNRIEEELDYELEAQNQLTLARNRGAEGGP